MEPSSQQLILATSAIVFVAMISILGTCLWCRKRKKPSDEFVVGLEGMVKLTNPDDALDHFGGPASSGGGSLLASVESKSATAGSEANASGAPLIVSSSDVKRNAPHRSLPDIPIPEPPVADDTSELYATVGDKVQEKPQGRSPTSSLKKQASISQHSSISQADDFSSPYARVRSPPHAYDKIRHTEHPYAQVVSPGTSNGPHLPSVDDLDGDDDDDDDALTRHQPDPSPHGSSSEIPAASAIAGRISASQDLPYMTPPIVQPPTQHFSGDSQDSSKGYTSISVREPLANIIAQTKQKNTQRRRRDLNDYATVSDDSDEMYAAIDDPNAGGDLYTSGSETYAQIQPPPSSQMTVAVEINTTAAAAASTTATTTNTVTMRTGEASSSSSSHVVATPPHPAIDTLKGGAPHHIHSRQASSSSCASVGQISSPKPEKRQANSPLPPTPISSNVTSGRNSVASIIEISSLSPGESKLDKKKSSPAKDIEGMYAKVMKKNKMLSSVPSQDSSPVPFRRHNENNNNNNPEIFVSDPDIAKEITLPDFATESPIKGNEYETIQRRHKDPGYETIPEKRPAPPTNGNAADYAQIAPKGRFSAPPGMLAPNNTSLLAISIAEPPYETLKPGSDDDPNYEVLRPSRDSDFDGYAKIIEKTQIAVNDGYSSIKSVRGDGSKMNNNNNVEDDGSDIYSSIPYATIVAAPPTLDTKTDAAAARSMVASISSISEARTTPSTESVSSVTPIGYNHLNARRSECDSLTGSDTDYYESLNVKENPYERLQNDVKVSTATSGGEGTKKETEVADFYQV